MASIARKNLFEDIPRFLVAQAGIMFAVSLVTIQTGILNGFTRSTTLLIEHSRADIWVASDKMEHFELTRPLLLEQLVQARQVSGVQRAEALMIGSSRWLTPEGQVPLRIFGFNPTGQLFVPGTVTQGKIADLKTPYTVLIDEANLNKLHLSGVGDTGTVGSLPARVVGLVRGTQSIASSTFVFASLESAKSYTTFGLSASLNCTIQPSGEVKCDNLLERTDSDEVSPANPPPPANLTATDPITYILVKAEPDTNLQALMQRLDSALLGVKAYRQEAILEKTRDFWQNRTGVGFILGLGAAVGIIVGVVIVGQILYASVNDNLKEFGTLKAMGASDWVIYGVILEQALWMAVLGYVPGMLLCWGIGTWTMATQGIMILITPVTAVGVFGLTVLMCVSSAFFAIQKVTRVDPAIVFKA